LLNQKKEIIEVLRLGLVAEGSPRSPEQQGPCDVHDVVDVELRSETAQAFLNQKKKVLDVHRLADHALPNSRVHSPFTTSCDLNQQMRS
jgi:hypothetical protein